MASGADRGQGANRGGNNPGGKSVRRESVAAVRKATNNRTQLIIGGVAVALIAGVIVMAIVMNQSADARNDGYGTAAASTATVENGVITVSAGSPTKSIDIWADPLCPICGNFEHQFGQEIAEGVDKGQVAVRYHFMNFLNQQSASGDYSTRATAALQCVATESGSTPGVFAAFHERLFAEQPEEGGDSDWSNADLAAKATEEGASEAAAACIADGTLVEQAGTTAEAASKSLQEAGGTGTPTVVHNGEKILTDDSWFANLVAS